MLTDLFILISCWCFSAVYCFLFPFFPPINFGGSVLQVGEGWDGNCLDNEKYIYKKPRGKNLFPLVRGFYFVNNGLTHQGEGERGHIAQAPYFSGCVRCLYRERLPSSTSQRWRRSKISKYKHKGKKPTPDMIVQIDDLELWPATCSFNECLSSQS